MERADYPALHALGFTDDELKTLGLWEPVTGTPEELAEMYVRRSKKKDTLSSLREHVRRMCAHAANEGKRIRHVWFEQKSASKSYVRREEFERATAAITKSRLSRTLYVFKISRLSRRGMGQVGLLLDTLDELQSRIYSVSEHLDSSKARMLFAILSEQARDQAADIATFTKVGIDGNKSEGRWTGGVAPFGLYSPRGSGKLEHHPTEYPTARRIAVYLLNRFTPAWIANKLNSENEKTRHGKKWMASGIISLAHSVTWAGLVANREKMLDEQGRDVGKYHRGGTPLLDAEGHPISCGKGVISFAEHVKINKILSERARPGTSIGDRTRGKRETITLLTGTFRCPHCKGPMVNGGPNYRCYTRQMEGESSCTGISTDRKRIDAAVEWAWVSHISMLTLESPTLHAIAQEWLSYQDPEKEARKRQVTAALESAVGREMKLRKDHFVLNRITEADYEYLWHELNKQIESLKEELAELSKTADLTPLLHPEHLMTLWNGESSNGRRALLKAAVKTITITPPKHRGDRTPIAKRMRIEWKDTENLISEDVIDAAFERVERNRQQRAAEQTA
ncbi:recombinase family protein [Streptomyces cinereoruber]|uniref:recombinase family protein n=1 Tax=Streptomyces cinereoruber TaxID=67260 RepID=UPI0033991240